MSLDVSLIFRSSGVYGVNFQKEVFSANITHNLTQMADEAGIYWAVWRPEEIGITKAWQMIDHLVPGLVKLLEDPARFRVFDAPNKWGTYEDFVPWLEKYLEACVKYPHTFVWVSR